jgi:hypothetical protein
LLGIHLDAPHREQREKDRPKDDRGNDDQCRGRRRVHLRCSTRPIVQSAAGVSSAHAKIHHSRNGIPKRRGSTRLASGMAIVRAAIGIAAIRGRSIEPLLRRSVDLLMHALLLSLSVLTYEVLISAGHEGRPASCARFPQHHCNLGANGEREWTPIVADAATRILRSHGVSVARLPADFVGMYRVQAAVFIHFDGSEPPCHSAASIGYARKRDAAAATWRALYSRYWRFGFEPDNFTVGLRHYYAFEQVEARDGSLVLELGEITCPAQHAWLAPRLQWEGALLAYFLSEVIGKGSVSDPGAYRDQAPTKEH